MFVADMGDLISVAVAGIEHAFVFYLQIRIENRSDDDVPKGKAVMLGSASSLIVDCNHVDGFDD